jgi:hypothetical protein
MINVITGLVYNIFDLAGLDLLLIDYRKIQA